MTPAIVNVPAVELASAHEAPLSVIVATLPELVSAPVQFENPVGKVTAAPDAGSVTLGLNVTEIVLPDASAPDEEVLNPTVHVATDPADVGDAAKLTKVTAELIVTPDDAAAAMSSEVLTVKSLDP